MKLKKILLLSRDPDIIRIFKAFHNEGHTVTVIKNISSACKALDKFLDSIDLVFIHQNNSKEDYSPLIQMINKRSISFINPHIVVVDNRKDNFALKIGADIVCHRFPDEKDIDLIIHDDRSSLNLNAIINHAASMIRIKDTQTAEHCRNTAKISSALASLYMQYFEGKSLLWHQNLKTAALLHDIGKVLISESVLRKSSRLTDDEFRIMKSHTKLGGELFKNMMNAYPGFELLSLCAEVCFYHHERFDGTGYPDGLKGDGITLEARIVAIADVFDALTSDRYYRNARTFDEALQIMRYEEEGHFDPKLFDLFVNNSDIFIQIKLQMK